MMMETRRLLIKPLSEEDTDQIFALTANPEVAKYMRFDTHTDRSQAIALIREYGQKGDYAFTVWEKSGGMLGVFVLKPEEDADTYSMSAYSAPDCWNQGYNSEQLEFFKRYAAEKLSARYLTAYVVGGNTGSCRALEKNGFEVYRTLNFPDLPDGLLVYRLKLDRRIEKDSE